MVQVPGINRAHKVSIYTLSTCGWCRKMKELLKALGIDYEYIDLDLLSGDERERAREKLRQYNPRISTPTLVIDDGKEVIIGFKEDEVRRCLSNGG